MLTKSENSQCYNRNNELERKIIKSDNKHAYISE